MVTMLVWTPIMMCRLRPPDFLLGCSPLVVEPAIVGRGREAAGVLGEVYLKIPEWQGALLNQSAQHRRHFGVAQNSGSGLRIRAPCTFSPPIQHFESPT